MRLTIDDQDVNDVRVVLLRRMTHKDLDTIRRELVSVRFELRTIFPIIADWSIANYSTWVAGVEVGEY